MSEHRKGEYYLVIVVPMSFDESRGSSNGTFHKATRCMMMIHEGQLETADINTIRHQENSASGTEMEPDIAAPKKR